MSDLSVVHTLSLFRTLRANPPPLLPGEIASAMSEASGAMGASPREDDDILVVFGKLTWPYREAFGVWVAHAEDTMGEAFFLGHLPRELARKYREFAASGGSIKETVSAPPMSLFSPDERLTIYGSARHMADEVRSYAAQQVLSVCRREYEAEISRCRAILARMEEEFLLLRDLAISMSGHADIAREIIEKVRAFEHGLALLGEATRPDEVWVARDAFLGRIREREFAR